ncbi:MAG TPA: FAD-dependent oxidoreductase [Gemmatimonadota bacterium]|nr:FAD-dependent oxidoreductase [Gemmatimonadota bacterium]
MIERDPAGAAGRHYDLAVIGGGIYGISLALEATRRGLRPVLLERRDFGSGTTWNNLRILHGGLRHLQRLDLRSARDSVRERRWYLRTFPELVRPLACVMPLYGRGLRRPAVLRAALLASEALSAGLRSLPPGRVLSAGETAARFPGVETDGLRGAALWYDAAMPDSPRLLIEMARWASAGGATLLNYLEATDLVQHGGRVKGVRGTDSLTGDSWEFRAGVVVNCAGPWCRELAARFDRDIEELFRPSLAFNVLLDRAPLADAALAVEPPQPGSRTCFVVPWKGRMLAGTYHAPRPGGMAAGPPEREWIRRFLEDLNEALPGLELGEPDVTRVFWGLLPATEAGTCRLALREEIRDHGGAGGPAGLFSVSGVKFTTARRVAERALERIYGSSRPAEPSVRPPSPALLWREFENVLGSDPEAARLIVDRLVEEEAVMGLDDLLLRRTDWGLHPGAPPDIPARIRELRPQIPDREVAPGLAGSPTDD